MRPRTRQPPALPAPCADGSDGSAAADPSVGTGSVALPPHANADRPTEPVRPPLSPLLLPRAAALGPFATGFVGARLAAPVSDMHGDDAAGDRASSVDSHADAGSSASRDGEGSGTDGDAVSVPGGRDSPVEVIRTRPFRLARELLAHAREAAGACVDTCKGCKAFRRRCKAALHAADADARVNECMAAFEAFEECGCDMLCQTLEERGCVAELLAVYTGTLPIP